MGKIMGLYVLSLPFRAGENGPAPSELSFGLISWQNLLWGYLVIAVVGAIIYAIVLSRKK